MAAFSSNTAPDASMVGELAIADPALAARLADGLREAEERLRGYGAEAGDPRVAEIVGHLIGTGGKRLRPMLALLGGEFGTPDPVVTVKAAALAEIVHVASLYHDDVMDQARTRRGVPSVNERWGNRTAVLAGNWLLAKAAWLAAELGAETVRLQARVTNRLVHGQVRELAGSYDGQDALSHYFNVVSGKSAALIAMALQIGAVQAGVADAEVQALAEYGEHLGVAFQIADDILDITSSSAVLGKEQGKDLAIGVASLPVLIALTDDGPETAELRRLLTAGRAGSAGAPEAGGPGSGPRAGGPGTTTLPHTVALLESTGVLDQARSMMHDRLARARVSLALLPDVPAKQVLHSLCDFVARRDH
ncbi:polyprenyl synthetase family protein [Streptomyces pactum]|uniref:Polyprenyl synthetase family protein n=1 Tax=Streptomyces pactum TaxID=68249 RepID=A0ABS0NJF4_9ACTN|nr:polyprenyl synthetase family protein [Streptomyces pactum]MBH5335336.1 polyprenyl synthetase family protein [Streptomyces pactum]